jgi:hypothetical protein
MNLTPKEREKKKFELSTQRDFITTNTYTGGLKKRVLKNIQTHHFKGMIPIKENILTLRG